METQKSSWINKDATMQHIKTPMTGIIKLQIIKKFRNYEPHAHSCNSLN